MNFQTTTCVVLNSTYEPLTVISAKRALILILDEKAVLVEEHPTVEMRSPSVSFKAPTMIALKTFVKGQQVFKKFASLTQKNLFIRDDNTCQYCQRSKSEFRKYEFLTRDHVYPKSKGGQNTWENLVTTCSTCNNKKGNKLTTEVNMHPIKRPVAPTLFEIWMKKAHNHI